MAVGDIPLYFEGSWSILSTIGLVNFLLGFMVVGITGYSPIALVPIVVSGAAAIANGLCYYALYEEHSTNATLVSAVFADLFWLIQEAGLSFYSYMILNRVLRSRSRIVFLALFWLLMTVIVATRFGIMICRARNTANGNLALQYMVARLHIGYFVAIAVVEILSSFFLLRIFTEAKKSSAEVASRGGLFHYLTQSTELRLATLALIGITRAITYSFQKTMKASDVTGQIDRFVFTLECLFPVIMYIDILASRVARANQSYPSIPNSQGGSRKTFPRSRNGDVKMYSVTQSMPRMTAAGLVSSSQERIVSGTEEMGVKSIAETVEDIGDRNSERIKDGTISKTVEFEFHATSA
ncbi:hypothetical protein FB567DRAFT_218971 [Paraphoma chrysanthemicola]|uniref:Uncharacterized protein n=1 Tax=Paraphoma chrysanthemicola TaxID=798071 RepID=A0A8K0VS73_9PLEO|nr:hypothetical protein FB567DRAFT_218971 [Paraphoma chrysanthemicola]